MVRCLFRNVVCALVVVEVPVAGEGLAENRVERLLDAAENGVSCTVAIGGG